MILRRRRYRSLSDLIRANLALPDQVPTPPIDLLQILMDQPG